MDNASRLSAPLQLMESLCRSASYNHHEHSGQHARVLVQPALIPHNPPTLLPTSPSDVRPRRPRCRRWGSWPEREWHRHPPRLHQQLSLMGLATSPAPATVRHGPWSHRLLFAAVLARQHLAEVAGRSNIVPLMLARPAGTGHAPWKGPLAAPAQLLPLTPRAHALALRRLLPERPRAVLEVERVLSYAFTTHRSRLQLQLPAVVQLQQSGALECWGQGEPCSGVRVARTKLF